MLYSARKIVHDIIAAAAPDISGHWYSMAGQCQEKETLWANVQERRVELKDSEVTGYYIETTKKMCVRNSIGRTRPSSVARPLGVTRVL